MPKLRKSPKQIRCAELLGEIKKQQIKLDIDAERTAAALHVSRATYYNRLRNPEEFTFGELLRLSELLKCDFIFEERKQNERVYDRV